MAGQGGQWLESQEPRRWDSPRVQPELSPRQASPPVALPSLASETPWQQVLGMARAGSLGEGCLQVAAPGPGLGTRVACPLERGRWSVGRGWGLFLSPASPKSSFKGPGSCGSPGGQTRPRRSEGGSSGRVSRDWLEPQHWCPPGAGDLLRRAGWASLQGADRPWLLARPSHPAAP